MTRVAGTQRVRVTDEQPAAAPVPSGRALSLPQLLTLPEVAEVLQVSPKTVRRLVGRGFPHVRFGRVLRFDPADVQRWIVARSS